MRVNPQPKVFPGAAPNPVLKSLNPAEKVSAIVSARVTNGQHAIRAAATRAGAIRDDSRGEAFKARVLVS